MDPKTAELLRDFEATALDPGALSHRMHVHIAWATLRRDGLDTTLATLPTRLRRLTAAAGVPDKFHATVTGALLLLIHERLLAMAPDHDFATFAAAHPELLGPSRALLLGYYSPARLDGPLARQSFLLPERRRA